MSYVKIFFTTPVVCQVAVVHNFLAILKRSVYIFKSVLCWRKYLKPQIKNFGASSCEHPREILPSDPTTPPWI